MGQVTVAAVMTAARYECVWARTQIEKQCKTLGIPLTISGGVYYGQCMQKMFESLIDTDCDYVVTIDSDSIFTAEQLNRLIAIASQEQQIDAICGLQVRRGKAQILATNEGQTEAKWEGYPIKVTTAHFGLTVISMDGLRRTEKPWFVSTPDANGQWNDGKIDDDIHFWYQWKKAGNSIYVDPGTRIGHLEEMIAICDEAMQVTHMYPADWCDE